MKEAWSKTALYNVLRKACDIHTKNSEEAELIRAD